MCRGKLVQRGGERRAHGPCLVADEAERLDREEKPRDDDRDAPANQGVDQTLPGDIGARAVKRDDEDGGNCSLRPYDR